MDSSRPLQLVLAALLTLVTCVVGARDDAFVPDPEPPVPASVQEGEPWSEGAVRLPAWPRDADLVYFPVDGNEGGFRYAIDGRALEIGRDQVVRYTLVAESASGARNLSFEGIRCTPKGHYRVYAYGTSGRFAPVPETDWQPIAQDGTERYRYDLWRSYLCVHLKFAPRGRQDILRILRRGRVANREGTGFMSD